MKPAPFDYVMPKSLSEACAMLATPDRTAVAMAGGQSLMPMLALRVAPADVIVDIGRLDELRGIAFHGGSGAAGVRIGAGTTHAEIEDGRNLDGGHAAVGLLRRVASGISYRSVRNHGTIGGSLALADPAADWPTVLSALVADVRITGPNGTRVERVSEFVTGAYSTSLEPGEIVVGIDVPLGGDRGSAFKSGYAKVSPKSGAFATAIACVARGGSSANAVLGGTTTRPQCLQRLSEACSSAALPDEERLRAAIADDLAGAVPDADAYQQRLYTATLLRAAREAFQ